MPAHTPIHPHMAFLQALGAAELLIIVSLILALFIIIPLIFVAIAIVKAKKSSEKDYVPYHLMEPEERLLMLQGLRAKELIGEEEYEKKRQNILRELDDNTGENPATPPSPPQETPQQPGNTPQDS